MERKGERVSSIVLLNKVNARRLNDQRGCTSAGEEKVWGEYHETP